MAIMVTSVTMVPEVTMIFCALSSYIAVRAIACIKCLSEKTMKALRNKCRNFPDIVSGRDFCNFNFFEFKIF